MKRKTRTKVKRILLSIGVIIGIIIIGVVVYFIKEGKKEKEISYEDGIVCKNFFKVIEIDISNKKVTRDGKDSTILEEFDISKELEDAIFSSQEEMNKFLSNSVFEISYSDNVFKIQNPYQRKCIIAKAEKIKDKIEGEEILEIYPNIFIINFSTEKLTKIMYNYYKDQSYIDKIYLDDIYIDEPIKDISQTVYGDTESDLKGYHTLIVTQIGMDNYKKMINENGNPSKITVSTIGYGINYENEIFNDRITKKCYNFMLDNNDIKETIPQGSRIAEVIVDSTTNNVKILPLVIVTEEGYTSLSAIIKSIYVATKKSDVICYEITNPQNEIIDLAIKEAFKANIPFCTVSSVKEEKYPSSSEYTISASSLDKEFKIADYSGSGKYIDFAIPSTDVEEIFNPGSSVSRWSGSQYANAELVSIMALIKTYNKEATVLNIYNFIRNYVNDLGDVGKDDIYGYGVPIFSNIKISDIDKNNPLFKEIKYEKETWEKLKKLNIIAEDNIRINSWAVTKNENEPNVDEWNQIENITNNIEYDYEIIENGNYYIFVQDSAGNRVKQNITIEKIDNVLPEITYNINKDTLNDGYVTIDIQAEDKESGLADSPFSFDKLNWSNENNKKVIRENGKYKVYAKDKLENIGEVEILIDCFQEEGIAEIGEGSILQSIYVSAEWEENTNNNVQIKLNNQLEILAWQITTDDNIPNTFIEIQPQKNIDIQNENNTNNTYINSNINANNSIDTNNINSSSSNSIINNSNNNINTNIDYDSNNRNENNNVTYDNSIELNNIVIITDTSNNRKNNTNKIEITSRANQNVRESPIVLKVSLEINTLYYFWIKDSNGDWNYQTFEIHKKQI